VVADSFGWVFRLHFPVLVIGRADHVAMGLGLARDWIGPKMYRSSFIPHLPLQILVGFAVLAVDD